MKGCLSFLCYIFLCTAQAQPPYLHQINSEKELQQMSGLPLSNKYGNVISVKVVYSIYHKKIYFIQSQLFEYHYNFCKDVLGYTMDLAEFNRYNYEGNPAREYYLFNLNYYKDLKKYIVEFSAFDKSAVEVMCNCMAICSKNLKWNPQLHLLLNSQYLLQNKPLLEKKINCILPGDVFAELNFQSLQTGRTQGKLKVIEDFEREKFQIVATDIVILKNTPAYLPCAAGVVVAEFQTPLSHLCLIAKNRTMPLCAIRNIYNSDLIKKFRDSLVEFIVTEDSFRMFLIKKRSLKYTDSKKKYKSPEKVMTVDTIIPIAHLRANSAAYAGHKARNFSLLYVLSKSMAFKTPENAYAIPIYFYEQHAKKAGVEVLLNRIENDTFSEDNSDTIVFYLKRIRQAIRNCSLDKDLLLKLEQHLQKQRQYAYRFRSSSNIEDIEGFSAAGLHDSETGFFDSAEKSFEMAIKKVWASLWSPKAFWERRNYQIPQKWASMAVLVHRNFPDEFANGVAITHNPFRNSGLGYFINLQMGNHEVVAPDSGIVSEQIVCYPPTVTSQFSKTVEVITFSSLSKNQLIANSAELLQLTHVLFQISEHPLTARYFSKLAYPLKLDIEFKFDAQHKLYIKQIRPWK